MAEITAQLVKELRERSGAGMMDCKKALAENNGDMDAAIDWLRTKGLAAAAKKAGRIAAEGLVGVAAQGTKAVIVEVNAETDFVARNESFQEFVRKVAEIGLSQGGDLAKSAGAAFPGTGRNVQDELAHRIATIGENMSLRRMAQVSVSQGAVATYIHSATAPGLGRIGVLVGLESTGDQAKLLELGRQIAMHIAATNPLALTSSELDPAVVERERTVLVEQAKESGKPANIIDKMVEGRIRKFYEEVVLTEQVFVIDGETRVGKVVENAAKTIGAPVKLTGFIRYALGEGIEKQQTDFAAEVAATVR